MDTFDLAVLSSLIGFVLGHIYKSLCINREVDHEELDPFNSFVETAVDCAQLGLDLMNDPELDLMNDPEFESDVSGQRKITCNVTISGEQRMSVVVTKVGQDV